MFATSTKICTDSGSSTDHSVTFPAHCRALLLAGASNPLKADICPGDRVSGESFSAIHFRGCLLRQVSCYTLLSGFQLPWPPSCCL